MTSIEYEVQLSVEKWNGKKFFFQDQQLLPNFLHTFLNLTQHQDMEKEATVEEIVGGEGGQPDTASLVILLVGSCVLFLFYLGLKYYTTDSFRWIQEYKAL